MADCPLYRVHRITLRSREIRSDRQSSSVRHEVPWCSHAHSPLPEFAAKNAIGVAGLLQCGGDQTRCQVPESMRCADGPSE